MKSKINKMLHTYMRGMPLPAQPGFDAVTTVERSTATTLKPTHTASPPVDDAPSLPTARYTRSFTTNPLVAAAANAAVDATIPSAKR